MSSHARTDVNKLRDRPFISNPHAWRHAEHIVYNFDFFLTLVKALRCTRHNHRKAVPCSLAARATAAASSWCFLRKVQPIAFAVTLSNALYPRLINTAFALFISVHRSVPINSRHFRADSDARCSFAHDRYIVCDGRSLLNILTPGRVAIFFFFGWLCDRNIIEVFAIPSLPPPLQKKRKKACFNVVRAQSSG